VGDLGAVSTLSAFPRMPLPGLLAGVPEAREPKGRLSPQGVARAAAAPLRGIKPAREVFPRPRGKSLLAAGRYGAGFGFRTGASALGF